MEPSHNRPPKQSTLQPRRPQGTPHILGPKINPLKVAEIKNNKKTRVKTHSEETHADRTPKAEPKRKQKAKRQEEDKRQPKISLYIKTHAVRQSQNLQGVTGTSESISSSNSKCYMSKIERESQGGEGTREGEIITYKLGDSSKTLNPDKPIGSGETS